MPIEHNRRSIRLKDYDYSSNGLFFITICTKNRIHQFGEIIDEKMVLNEYGKIAQTELLKTMSIREQNVIIHSYVIMPNHIHFIAQICNSRRGVLHTPNEQGPRNTNIRRGVSHTPNENESENTNVHNGVLHTPQFPPIAKNDCVDNPQSLKNILDDDDMVKNMCDVSMGVCNTPLRSPSKTIGSIVRGYKGSVSKQIGFSVWQRNYYEHIIRTPQSYECISHYINTNPQRWNVDCMYEPS